MKPREPERKDSAQKKQRPPFFVLSVTLLLILVVLILSNFDAIMRPFSRLSSILTPITLGLIIAYLANPILRVFEFRVFYRMKSRRANRNLSLLCTYVVLLLLVAGVIFLIVPQLLSSIGDLRANGVSYVNRLIDFVNKIIRAIPFIDEDPDKMLTFEKILNYVLELLNNYSDRLISGAGNLASGVLNVLKNILVGFFISLYVLLSKDRLGAGCRRAFRALLSPAREETLLYYIKKAHSKFGGFFIGKIVDSIIIGVLSAVIFLIFRIPYPILIATIVGVTNVVPFFGPFIGAIPSAIIIFINSPMKALVFVVLILIIQQFDGNILGPLILGDRTGLSSLGILVSITLASGIWGFMGMLFGVPLFALLMAILDDFVEYRLRKKGEPTGLYDYYPADAFIRPQDIEKKGASLSERFKHWVTSVETEAADAPAKHPRLHKIGRGIRRGLLAVGRKIGRISRCMTADGKTLPSDGEPLAAPAHILPEEPAPRPHEEALSQAPEAAPVGAAEDSRQKETAADFAKEASAPADAAPLLADTGRDGSAAGQDSDADIQNERSTRS